MRSTHCLDMSAPPSMLPVDHLVICGILHQVVLVPVGVERRPRLGGPLVPGPWAYMFRLWRETDARDPHAVVVEIGDVVVVAGLTYYVDVDRAGEIVLSTSEISCSALDVFVDDEMSEDHQELFRLHLYACSPCRTNLSSALALRVRLASLRLTPTGGLR